MAFATGLDNALSGNPVGMKNKLTMETEPVVYRFGVL